MKTCKNDIHDAMRYPKRVGKKTTKTIMLDNYDRIVIEEIGGEVENIYYYYGCSSILKHKKQDWAAY